MHEFGHYLVHRLAYPDGIQCGEQDVVRWDSEYGQIEHQANVFSAGLLMPLDDFRRQIPEHDKVDLDMLSHCADRYRVSLIAAVLRWPQYTQRRAVLVVSRDGFILWSRASGPALKTGAFFRTSGPPIAIPVDCLASHQDMIVDGRTGIELPAGVWFSRTGARDDDLRRAIRLPSRCSCLRIATVTFSSIRSWKKTCMIVSRRGRNKRKRRQRYRRSMKSAARC